jgi:hypothetical protein
MGEWLIDSARSPTCVCDVRISSLFDPVDTAGGCTDVPPPPVAAVCTAVRTALTRLSTVLLTSEMLDQWRGGGGGTLCHCAF